MTRSISNLAAIHPDAKIGNNVSIGPFTTIHSDVEIGDDVTIYSNVTIFEGARIAKGVTIFPGAVISAIPQDLKFNNEYTTVEIGENTTIREYVTINRGTDYHYKTKVGKNCLLMAYVHVAHDCLIGNNVILANAVNLAGHVEIADNVIIGGMSAVHQFCKIGTYAFLSGGSMLTKDVPPYVKGARQPVSYVGVNSVGLKRNGFDNDQIHRIQDIYRKLFIEDTNVTQAIKDIEEEVEESAEKKEIMDFIENSSRGLMKGY